MLEQENIRNRLTWDEIYDNASKFSLEFRDAHNEEAQGQTFVTKFLQVFGINEPMAAGNFERKVELSESKSGYIDYLWEKQIAIEMKSKGKNLKEAFRQLKNYMEHLDPDIIPDLWLVSDFEKMILTRRSTNESWEFATKNLRKRVHLFANIAGYTTERSSYGQVEVNVKAAERMARLHDALKDHGYDGHILEVYLVRLLFCLFAEDTGIFPPEAFSRYLKSSKTDGSDLSDMLARLFEILDMPEEIRRKRNLTSETLLRFRYVNGRLFDGILPRADFDSKMRKTLLDCADFDWGKISPAIFGSLFQGVMDKKERRDMGAHYTSEENILKVINPLFMDALWKEFDRVKTDPRELSSFHDKISNLCFLDPACGCGNFLIITYRELRLLEIEILKILKTDKLLKLSLGIMQKVSLRQFYGIESLDFPCQIAEVGLWLMDHQMNLEASDKLGRYQINMPLSKGATILHKNALRIDWEEAVPRAKLSYIMGNPPFGGGRTMSKAQKDDMAHVFGKIRALGDLDYVTAWYKRASDMMRGTEIRAAFVSTSSVAQGEQPALLWKPLMEEGAHINFAMPSFKWSNEARGKAAVNCVIIGFSHQASKPNINPYLVEGPNVFIFRRGSPLCDAPPIGIGSMPIDDGNYLFTDTEKADFLKKEPKAGKWFRPWVGSEELIKGHARHCLFLKDCPPSELQLMPECLKRIRRVRDFRLASKNPATRKLAEFPLSFHNMRLPDSA
ncbi:MAG: class I SAM-dependent DNA methyltransferase, partial [Deltaproteobacteria bacterium]|nr:class I SAM-dependent DNA methyltransferase [Deltaproteobacteria bacterium]